MAPQSSESDPKLVLQKLQHCLGLGGSSAVQDVIFYSLNLKASRGKKRKEYVDWIEEIGLYSLDTRDFNRAACGWHIVHVSKIMKRYMDNLECPYPGRYPDYIYGSRHWFQHVQGEIEAMLLQQFYQEETREQASYNGQFRKIVLVGHGIQNDIEILEDLGIKFHQIHTIIRIVDTQKIGKVVLGKEMSLDALMLSLGTPCIHPDNTGNNAYDALLAVFLLVYQSYTAPLSGDGMGEQLQDNLLWMRNIALTPIRDVTNKLMEPVIQRKNPDTIDWTNIVDVFGVGKGSLFEGDDSHA